MLIMENSIYKIAFLVDMLFDLSVNKCIMISQEKPLTTDDRDWFNLRLKEVDIKVRELICFLLAEQETKDTIDEESLCYTLYKKHIFHLSMLPVKIENLIVAYICEMWYVENGNNNIFSSHEAAAELKSLALKQSNKYSRKYKF